MVPTATMKQVVIVPKVVQTDSVVKGYHVPLVPAVLIQILQEVRFVLNAKKVTFLVSRARPLAQYVC